MTTARQISNRLRLATFLSGTLAERNAARNAERDRLHRENAERAALARQEWAEREAAQRREREERAAQARLEQQQRQAALSLQRHEFDCGTDGGIWSAETGSCALSEEARARRQARVRAEGERKLETWGRAMELLFQPQTQQRAPTRREQCLNENPTNLNCY